MENILERITVSPTVAFGKPCIAGTRIPVTAILEILEDGIPMAQIPEKYYPDVTIEDIKACVEYAIRVIGNEEIHLSAASK